MKRLTFLLALFCLTFTHLELSAQNNSKQKFTISGYIEDADSGEKLIAANVFDLISAQGAVTNTYGFFSLTLPSDSVTLHFSYIGYQTQEIKLFLKEDVNFNLKLSSAVDLATVQVIAEKRDKIEEETQMSRIDIPIEQIKKVPALLGEVDVLKTIQLLPGVQSGNEGQSGIYVRGGGPDQNLILLDGVPIYNVSHVLGIFSVFNADAIKNVTLTKGGFPARFGGRLSSVLEINMKEGNMQKFHAEGSLGLISSKLTVEGPIIKDKTSFIISGRRTYADLIAKPIAKKAATRDGFDLDLSLYFYDLNAKLNHKINDKHRLYLSAYTGSDIFKNKIKEDNNVFGGGIDWGNIISAFRWNYQISNKLFSNTTLTYSNYQLDIFAEQSEESGGETSSFSAKYFSGIQDYAAKIDLDYIPNPNHYIRFGAGVTRHTYKPGALSLKSTFDAANFDTLLGSQNAHSREYQLYVEDDIRWGALKANLGLHFSAFDVDGAFYTSLQPRIGLRYLMSNKIALKASFTTMRQYINLLTSEALTLPTDLWVPSTDKVKPQESWQAAVGVAKTFWDQYEFSVEGYYKKMNNVLSFKEGSSFLFGLENDWQEKITQGQGESYGLEVFLQKKKGKTTGWIGYTLSWNNRQFGDVNGGKWFPYRFDRRNDVSIVLSHELTQKILFSAAWIYGTGNAITLPIYKYSNQPPIWGELGGQNIYDHYAIIETNGEKNAFRTSDYHRLDVSVEFVSKKPTWESSWIVSVYNAYWNRNPYYVISENEDIKDANGVVTGQKQVFKEVSVLPIIPSISWKFKFLKKILL